MTASAHDRRTNAHRATLSLAALLAACAGSKPTPDPTASQPQATTTAQQPEATPSPTGNAAPTAGVETNKQQGSLLKRLPLENRLDVALLRATPDLTQSAEFGLMLQGGTETGRPGSAELAAHLLIHGADATSGRQNLARQIEQLGGTLTLDIGRKSTWLHVRCPTVAWQRAAQAVSTALDAKDQSRSQAERAQQELLTQTRAITSQDPVRAAAQRLLLGDSSPAEQLQHIQDRDAGEALGFQRRYFRPDRTLLAVRAPGNEPQIEAAVRATFGTWEPGNPVPQGEITTEVRPAASGIAWIRNPLRKDGDACDVALALQLPEARSLDGVAQHVLANCVTIDGIGGRLERLMQEAGLGKIELRAETIRVGESAALALRGTMQPDQALRLYATAIAARQSLRDIPISTSERTQARAAAWLSLRSAERDGPSLLRDEVERIVLGVDAAMQMERLAELDRPGVPDSASVRDHIALPVALVVHGGELPQGQSAVRLCPLEPEALSIPVAGGEDEAQRAAARPWRTRAIEAIGGPDKLGSILGFTTERRVVTEGAPEIEETATWKANGDLQRTRKVLGAVIETRLQGNEWMESASGKQAQLTPQEAEWRRREAARHPLALLVAWGRDELVFRRVGVKKVGDRELQILEATGDRFERLRIEIDAESGLLRTVECWATAPEGAASRSVDTWTDYRSVEGIRVPFRCTTSVDDGQSQRDSTYTRVLPLRN